MARRATLTWATKAISKGRVVPMAQVFSPETHYGSIRGIRAHVGIAGSHVHHQVSPIAGMATGEEGVLSREIVESREPLVRDGNLKEVGQLEDLGLGPGPSHFVAQQENR